MLAGRAPRWRQARQECNDQPDQSGSGEGRGRQAHLVHLHTLEVLRETRESVQQRRSQQDPSHRTNTRADGGQNQRIESDQEPHTSCIQSDALHQRELFPAAFHHVG